MVEKSQKFLKKKYKKAFTLLELSVVLLVAGLLTSIVLVGGNSLIRSANISTARSATSDSPIQATEGLIAWYESSMADSFNPSEAAFNGSQLSNWYDRGPSSLLLKKNALSTTPSANVTYNYDGINGAQSIVFNGSGQLSISNFYQGSFAQATIFIVFSPSDSSSVTLLDSGPSSSTNSISITSSTITLNAGTAATTSGSGNPASFTVNKKYIIAAYFNNSNSKVYLNNTSTVVGNGTPLSIGTNIFNGITIGSNNAGGSGFSGQISEAIIFNRLLNTLERKDVMKYLARKYNIVVTGF
jgi:prepilin-type N-terminal cleavage/methylation domain-containing protein